jgi:photosystem II stability/assembly factor-like uncharacterized protein
MLLAFLLAIELSARWLVGLEGAVVSDVAVAAGSGRRVLVVASQDGSAIFRSEDGGSTWERIDDPPLGERYIEIATDPHDPNRVFAATSRAGFPWFWVRLFGSDDGGGTWTLRQSHDFATYPAAQIVFDAVEPNTLYTSYYDTEIVYRSVDRGETFTGLPAPFARAILVTAPDGALVAASEFAVWVSRDRAERWTRVADPPIGCPTSAVAVDRVSGRWWIGSGNPHPGCGEVAWSDDGGETWTSPVPFGAPVLDLATDPAVANGLFATIGVNDVSVEGRVLMTPDGGTTWNDLRIPVERPGELAVTPDGSRLYAATAQGVFSRHFRRPRPSPPPR